MRHNSMKLGCLDYNFNYLPFHGSAAKAGTYFFMGLARLGVVKRYRYTSRALQKISQLGFSGVQVMCENVRQMSLKPEELSALCSDLNLEITSLGGYTNFFDNSKMGKFKAVIEYAHDAGVKIICTHSGKGRESDVMLENFSSMVDEAAAHGVTIALENSPLHAVSTLEDVLSVTEAIPNLRLNFDPANFNLSGVDAVNAAKSLADKIVHVHAKDSIKPFSFPPIGKGEVLWPALINELKKSYEGYLVVEFEGRGNPLQQTIQDKAYLESLMNK